MRILLACLVISMTIMAASAAMTCFGDEDKCGEDECCIQIGTTIFGMCKKLHDVDKVCEVKPLKNLIKTHVYRVMCPCKAGLECVAKDGLVGKVAGKCQKEGSGEATEAEPAE